jgi:hypothetical protein
MTDGAARKLAGWFADVNGIGHLDQALSYKGTGRPVEKRRKREFLDG